MVSYESPTGGENVLGSVGHVTVPIPLNGPGEVLLAVRGGSEAFAAFCDQPVGRGIKVVVIDSLSARTVVVAPY